MSELTVFQETDPDTIILNTSDGDVMARELKSIGVRFERWVAGADLPKDADDAAVLSAYDADIKRLQAEEGYQSVDVIRIFPDNEKRVELRQKFLSEHTHDDDEVRFFVDGAGMFYLHVEGKVYMVLCEKGDFISVPAHTKHWFDMSAAPLVTAIRLFINPDGWIAKFTGDKLADDFPKFEREAA